MRPLAPTAQPSRPELDGHLTEDIPVPMRAGVRLATEAATARAIVTVPRSAHIGSNWSWTWTCPSFPEWPSLADASARVSACAIVRPEHDQSRRVSLVNRNVVGTAT